VNPTLDAGAPAWSFCRERRGGSVRFDDFVQGGALGRLAAGGASGGDQLRRVEPDEALNRGRTAMRKPFAVSR
jgi:hypothetical protein